MLDGIGGDDLLTVDYSHLTDLLLQKRFRKLLAQLWNDAKISSYYSPHSLFSDYCLKPLIPKPVKAPLKKIINLFRGDGIPSWFNMAHLKRYRSEWTVA